MRKNIILGCLFFTLFITIFLLPKLLSVKDNENIEKSIQEKNEVYRNQFAMYVENDDGEYVEYTDSNYFPENYALNLEKSYCVDKNEKELNGVLIYEDNKVTVTSNTTTYCYLYFEILKGDLTIIVSTDGISNTIPTSDIYKHTASCSSGNITYNLYYRRLEIGSFNNGTKCTLDYTKNDTLTSSDKLGNIVQNNATTNVNGYRYSGTNPDNYVWFNNELWRIIGLVPACTTASSGTCSARTNLVKIIRAESIGGLAYDAKSSEYTGLWGNNTLYTLLNSYYYGKRDGTETDYCYGFRDTLLVDCNYTKIGISSVSNDYYSQMIEDVYWNIGASTNEVIPGTIYNNEIKNVTIDAVPIGLMSASDYGYAAEIEGYGTKLSVYNTTNITKTNWLFGYGNEWTSTQYSSTSSNVLHVNINGNLYGTFGPGLGIAVRPVLYLNSGVYKISGLGTMEDPYIIGM